MKIQAFQKLLKDAVLVIAQNPNDLTDDEFVNFVSGVDDINHALKSDTVKKLIESI